MTAASPRSTSVVTGILPDPISMPGVVGRNPLLLFLSDSWLFLKIIVPHLLLIVIPQRSFTSFLDDISLGGLLFQVFMAFYTAILILPLLLLGFFASGTAPLGVAWILLWPFQAVQGSPLVCVPLSKSPVRGKYARSSPYIEVKKPSSSGINLSGITGSASKLYPRATEGEAWFFINGMLTSRSGLLLELHCLEKLFQRPIIGILNRSLGIIMDSIECIVQRDLLLHTRDVRQGYLELRAALEADNTNKVVFMNHSQGCIIGSLIMDLLLSTVSREHLKKLEVYTFANASNHFSNPRNQLNEPTIRHVEHYANGRDPIAQFGVLLFASAGQKAAARKRKLDKRMGITAEQADDEPVMLAFDDDDATITKGAGPISAGASIMSATEMSTAIGTSDENGTAPARRVHSAAGQAFSGRLFVRWNKSGHLLINHYIGEYKNILESKEAKRFSRLRKYKDGNSPIDV